MTTPLWSNVSLQLHCDGTNGSTTFIDETGKTVTAVDDVAVNTAQSKFGGASAYFGPSGGNLSVPNSASFDVGNGDFTAEAWVYTTTTSGLGGIIGYANGWASNSNYAFQMLRNGDKWQFEIVNGTNQYGGVAGTVVPNVWVHVAMVRHGANLYAFADGILLKTTDVSTLSANNPAGAVLHIGRVQGFYPWSGYIDDLRLVKGEALYTSNFTPPTGPHQAAPPFWLNTSLLLPFLTDFADKSYSPKTVTPQGNAQISGGGCLLDATGDYLIVSPGISFASGDFTAEYEVDFTATLAEVPVLCRRFGANGYWLHSGYSGGNLRVVWQQWTSGGVYNFLEAVVAHTLNTKIAVCVERVGDVLTIYTNGVSRASGTFSNRPGTPGTTTEIGRDQDGTAATLNGRIYNLRVTNDAYRYGGNYTPENVQPPIEAEMSGQLLPNGASFVEVDNPGLILAEMVGQLLPNGGSSLTVFNPGLIKAELSGMPTPNSGSRMLVASFVSEDVYLTIDGEFRIVSFEIVPVTVHGQFELEGGVPVAARQSLVVDGLVRVVNDTPCGCYGE